MTEIYLHIVARMADYMATHPYYLLDGVGVLLHVGQQGRRHTQPPKFRATPPGTAVKSCTAEDLQRIDAAAACWRS